MQKIKQGYLLTTRTGDIIEKKKNCGPAISKNTSKEIVEISGNKCNQCGKCCSFGSGFILEEEIPRIAAFLNTKKEVLVKEYLTEIEIFNKKIFKFRIKQSDKPYGECIFLENNQCGIHEVKPLHCRVCSCTNGEEAHAWFLVNHCLNIHDPESVRQYASYVYTGGKVLSGAELEKIFPDKKLLKDILEYKRVK